MGKGPLISVWAAAAVCFGLRSYVFGATSPALNLPRVIAASGTTVVDGIAPSLLANATQELAPAHGNLTLNFVSVDSPTDVRNWISGADDYAINLIGLNQQLYQQANRLVLQIPWAIANIAVIYNLPGTPEDALRLNPKVLAGIYSCTITSWQDPAIVALNPNLTLPDMKIIPASYSESKGTTYLLTRYMSLDPSWTLGSAVQIPWPRCVQHGRTPDGITAAVARAPGAIAWAADWRINATSPAQLYTAHLQNAAGNFIPSTSTYAVDSLPVPPITSSTWINVTFATSKQADIYPMGSFIFNIVGQDVSASGPDQAPIIKDLMAYFVSDAVQQSLVNWTLMPVPKALATSAQQAIASMIILPSNQTRGGQAASTSASPVGGGDNLVSGAAVVEGSGGASIQNLVKSVLANATTTGRFGNAGLTFAPTDSDQGKQGVISQSFAYAMSTLPLTQDELAAAGRPMVQVPMGYGPVAVIHSIPNVSNNALRLTPQVLAAIFQCQVTTWNDVAITAINPNLTLPNQPIYPLGLSDPSGTTALFATYLKRSAGWKLGAQTSLAWPRCVRRTIGGSNAMVAGVNATTWSLGYAALGSFIQQSQGIAVASVSNRGNIFVSPYNCPFPFHQDELPPSISSPAWSTLDFNATVIHADRYSIGGLIYMFTSQDLSLLGYPQSVIMQQLLLYWLSDAVQSNMSSMGASPLIASELQIARQQVTALNTEAAAPGMAPAPGVTAAGGPQSGSSQQSSKAGFPWWGGLIIALVALVLIGALAGLACFARMHRRRRRRGGALEEAIHKQDPALASKGNGGANHDGAGEHPVFPHQSSHMDGGDAATPTLAPQREVSQERTSYSSDKIVADERRDGVDDRMPLDHKNWSTRSAHSSGGTQRGSGSLQGSLNGQSRLDGKRKSSSYGRDAWGGTGDTSKGSWGGQSRAQSLNNEAAYSSLPDILKSRAENVDIEDIERGSLLGRGSFGKVYQGWWRGGMVAIKVVPHEGDLGEKVEVVRESLLSSSIQHPQVVTTYKAITVNHGAHQHMKREEAIPEGSAIPSRGSGPGSGSNNTNKSSGTREDMMETWIIMEYCDLGSLDNAISDGRFHGLEDLLLRLLDVAMGMEYLHKLGILHTDLKPSNVLLKTAPKQANDPTGCTCKLADFGLSRVMETNATHISTNTIGTIAYQPEEVLKEGKVTPASDVYSFAILMYELWTGKHLFKGLMHSQMFFKVFNGYRPPIPEGTPKGLGDLMEACWSHNPAERPSFKTIVRALQKLIIEQRRYKFSGKQASMNLDEALAGAEMAKQYPVAPSMPIQAPSREAPQSSSGSMSQQQTPQSSGQKMNDFELALLDIRKKAMAGQLPSQHSEQQAQESGNRPSNGNKAQPTERQKLSGDGPDTPPKLNSAGSPPPERAPLADSAAGAGRPPSAPPPSSAAAGMAGQSAGTAGPAADMAEASGSAPGSTAQGGPAMSPGAAHSMSPLQPCVDSWEASPPHIPLPPRMSKANRYDLLLGD